MLLQFECIQRLRVLVVDSQTRNIITNASLDLFEIDRSFKAKSVLESGTHHVFNTKYGCGESYRIVVDLPDYIIKEEMITLNTESGETDVTIIVEKKPVEPEFKKDDDLFKKLKLLPIHFDFDKSNIRPDAAIELDKIVQVMKKYPKMHIDVRSFTDSRGSSAYNLKLSDRRAKSTAQWIISQGISPDRVSYKGYGDTQLLNNCKKGVKCTEEQQQQNRRSEFIVKEM